MRTGLTQNLRARRRSRRGRHRRAAAAMPTVLAAIRPAASPEIEIAAADPDVQRVREAGGPLDEASYTCHCGFVFRAPVSTTVACPHCRAPQAW